MWYAHASASELPAMDSSYDKHFTTIPFYGNRLYYILFYSLDTNYFL
jgi:hypothetical protein